MPYPFSICDKKPRWLGWKASRFEEKQMEPRQEEAEMSRVSIFHPRSTFFLKQQPNGRRRVWKWSLDVDFWCLHLSTCREMSDEIDWAKSCTLSTHPNQTSRPKRLFRDGEPVWIRSFSPLCVYLTLSKDKQWLASMVKPMRGSHRVNQFYTESIDTWYMQKVKAIIMMVHRMENLWNKHLSNYYIQQ